VVYRRAETLTEVAFLLREVEPGENVAAGAYGQAGRAYRWERPVRMLAFAAWAVVYGYFIYGFVHGQSTNPAAVVAVNAAALLVTIPARRRKPTYIALAGRWLYVIRLSPGGRKPASVISRTPVAALNASLVHRGRWQSEARFDGPGLPGKGLRMLASTGWRNDLYQLVSALQASQTPPVAARS
jgi:hypothetical protein